MTSSAFCHNPRKVLLIEPPNSLTVGFNATVVVEPLGLEYIAGGLQDVAEVRILDMRVDPRSVEQVLNEYQADFVGIRENYTVDVESVREIARQVKKLDRSIGVVVGGHHVSLQPEDAYLPDVDAIVTGEGEWTLKSLIEDLQRAEPKGRTQNVIYRRRDGAFDASCAVWGPKTALKTFDDTAMNARPTPARHLVDHYRDDYYFLYHENPYSIEIARGCIYRCNFCSVHEFHRGNYAVQGNERTLQELASLPTKSWVNVVDDLAIQEVPASVRKHYPPHYDPMSDLADQVSDLNAGHRYWMQVRADNVVRNPKKFEKWARAGLDTVLIGLEAFDQGELNSVQKGTKPTDNVDAIKILHGLGVRIWGGVLVFQDWAKENFDHLKRSVLDLGIEFPQFTILTPLPGTSQWEKTQSSLITRESRFFDFLHSVLPTRLSPLSFYEEYSSLWQAVGAGGLARGRKMLGEVAATRRSVSRFLRQYKSLSSVATYGAGIKLLERGESRGTL